MQKDIKRLQSNQSRDQSRNRGRNQSRSPVRDQQSSSSGNADRQNDTQQTTLCFYHQKFGDNALIIADVQTAIIGADCLAK